MKVSVFLLLIILNGFVSSTQKENDSLNKLIIRWTKDYYFKKNPEIKDVKYVHGFLVEKYVVQDQLIALYTIGLNKSGTSDMILFYKRRSNGLEEFTVIGESDLKKNLQKLFELFRENKQISDKAKVICYERLLVDSDKKLEKRRKVMINDK